MADQETKTAKPTRRVVLKREYVIVLPADLTAEQRAEVVKAVRGVKAVKSVAQDTAWRVIGEFEGASQEKAIEAHAGKAGTPDAKVGDYKAPSVTNWKGGLSYTAPPAPLVERKPLEDA